MSYNPTILIRKEGPAGIKEYAALFFGFDDHKRDPAKPKTMAQNILMQVCRNFMEPGIRNEWTTVDVLGVEFFVVTTEVSSVNVALRHILETKEIYFTTFY